MTHSDLPCSHRGRRLKQEIYECDRHGRCTLDRTHERIMPCIGCQDRSTGDYRADMPRRNQTRTPCRFRGELLRHGPCPTCGGTVLVKVFACQFHAECQLSNKLASVHSCLDCTDFDGVATP